MVTLFCVFLHTVQLHWEHILIIAPDVDVYKFCEDNYIVNSKSIKCHLCDLKFHASCASINNNCLKYLSETDNLLRICDFCKGSVAPFKNNMEATVLEKEIEMSEIIKHGVADQKYEINEYPPRESFLETAATDIPQELKRLLNNLLLAKSGSEPSDGLNVQRDSTAYTIISALKPKLFISKLRVAIGTYILRKTGSTLIVNLLNKLGASASYCHTQLYEASTIMDPRNMRKENAFIQFVFDNTELNVNTMNGHETFHCL
nr:unnamed protein product [Callosobruchus chinensis]